MSKQLNKPERLAFDYPRNKVIDECFAWFRQEINKSIVPNSNYATVQNILKLKEQLGD